MISYLYLSVAILLEVTGTLLLPVSQHFTRVVPTVMLVICYVSSFYLLTFVLKTIPIAYATWAGLGVFTIALFGYFFFNQTLAWQAIVGLFLIVCGVACIGEYVLRQSVSVTVDQRNV